jgi:hypothetical protein
VVGGTLLWVAPAVQTLSAKAFAQTLESPGGACGTCYCVKYRANGTVLRDECNKDGITGIFASQAACEEFCRNGGSAHPGNTNAYTASASQWCQGTGFNCNCNSRTAGNPAPFGVNCT